MMSPRQKFIETYSRKPVEKKLAGFIWDAMNMAIAHDPDHAKTIRDLEKRVKYLESHQGQVF